MTARSSLHGFIHSRLFALLFVTTIAVFSYTASTSAAEATTPAQQRVTLDVRNMTCAMCPITVRKSLTRLDGVSKADVSYKHKTATVTFNPQKVTVEQLTLATTNAGYPATVRK